MARTQAFEIETRDWLADDALCACSSSTRGIWFDLLCRMHNLGREGELRGSREQFVIWGRCQSKAEFESAAGELQSSRAADVSEENGFVTIRNRRMYAESQKRKLAAERQAKHRSSTVTNEQNGECHAVVTQDVALAFERFWVVYPALRKTQKRKALDAFERAVARGNDPEKIIAAALEYAKSEVASSKWVKGPEPWLNGGCWDDDRASWRDLDRHQPLLSREYRQVSLDMFKAHKAADEFLVGPKQDTEPDADGFRRVHGQLKSGRKIESSTDPNYQPQN